MVFTRNQHMLSQWVLRNFRSDDTALSAKEKQRVWCHTVYISSEQENVLHTQPLPISSVAVSKNCFRLIDAETGHPFDIEDELGVYERLISGMVNNIIHEHNFSRLRHTQPDDFPVEKLASFAVMQLMLNLHNPQNKNPYKHEMLEQFHSDIQNHLSEYIHSINQLPQSNPELMDDHFYKKILRVANSASSDEDKCRALFVLFGLLSILNKPTLYDKINILRNKIFAGIRTIEVIHTGHDFDSTAPRPAFAIAPNIFCLYKDQNRIYLPLSHNFTLCFITGSPLHFKPRIDVYSPRPELLKCCHDRSLNFYKVSFDYIDNVMTTIDMYNVGTSSTFYSAYQLSKLNEYLDKQEQDHDHYYTPENPVLWYPAQADPF
ncbi:TPA: DUF4238 domain-containing protein [Salmonella enterica]|uniref:DUF4238 domain-containing protein n=1 Tax=Salmonella enterica TaxID=28901 RepID=UPI0009B0D87F|nr:DUF4238 domain-containing protein [Salmonella enterica]HBD1844125.1 DUF4238 domain-containing protein [Salmonella enterica]